MVKRPTLSPTHARKRDYDRADSERAKDSKPEIERTEQRTKERKAQAKEIVRKAEAGETLTKLEENLRDSPSGRIAIKQELKKRDMDPVETYADMIEGSVKESTTAEEPKDRLAARKHVTDVLAPIVGISKKEVPDRTGPTVIFNLPEGTIINDPGHKEPVQPIWETEDPDPDG